MHATREERERLIAQAQTELADREWIIVEELRGFGSPAVWKVQNAAGDIAVAKVHNPDVRYGDEIRALNKWADAGFRSPRARAMSEILMMTDWLDGRTLTPLAEKDTIIAVGALLRSMHQLDGDGFTHYAQTAELLHERTLSAPNISTQQKIEIEKYWAHMNIEQAQLIHGDCNYLNFMICDSQVVPFDPFGFAGAPSMDIARLVTAWPGDQHAVLEAVATGYGPLPSDFEATLRWYSIVWQASSMLWPGAGNEAAQWAAYLQILPAGFVVDLLTK